MTSDAPPPLQTWELVVDGRRHRVEVRGSVVRHVQWWVDDDLVAEKRSMDDKLRLTVTDDPDLGSLSLRFSGLGKPRRASITVPGDPFGTDLVPATGSPAAAFEERVRMHPRRHEILATLGGVAAVVVPILLTVLLARLAFTIDWPDWQLPSIPWPELPRIPWPDLPDLPLPDLSLPAWLREVLDKAKYVWPVLLAWGLARAEIKRRHKQDELRARQQPESASPDSAGPDD